MDRPTTGHRQQAGSITVVDLIRRQQGPVRIPSAREAATVTFMDDLLGEEEPVERPRGWVARSAKFAGLALGSLVLCGSVYAASTLTHHRAGGPAEVAGGPVASVLTGVGALRPDTVAAQLSGTAQPPPAPSTAPFAGSVATGRATGTVVGQATTSTTPTTQAQPAGQVSVVAVVRSFYQLVATDPDLATRLISPALLHGDHGFTNGIDEGFDNAWHSMTHIQVERIDQTSPHTVQAVVRMLGPDGMWLRVVELLHLTGGTHPLINGAELLSAQRG